MRNTLSSCGAILGLLLLLGLPAAAAAAGCCCLLRDVESDLSLGLDRDTRIRLNQIDIKN